MTYMRGRTDFAHLFGMWKHKHLNCRHGVQQIHLNLICFLFLAGLYKVISNSNYKCPNFTASCFIEKAKKSLCKGTICGNRTK